MEFPGNTHVDQMDPAVRAESSCARYSLVLLALCSLCLFDAGMTKANDVVVGGAITDENGIGVGDARVKIVAYPPLAGTPWLGTGPTGDLGRRSPQPRAAIIEAETQTNGHWKVLVPVGSIDYVVTVEKAGFTFGESGVFNSEVVKRSRFWNVPVRPGSDDILDFVDFVAYPSQPMRIVAVTPKAKMVGGSKRSKRPTMIVPRGTIVPPSGQSHSSKPAPSPPGRASIRGVARDIFGRGIGNVEIQVDACSDSACDVVTSPSYRFRTNTDGEYSGTNLAPGRYWVDYRNPSGYRYVRKKEILSLVNGREGRFDLTLLGLCSISGTVTDRGNKQLLRRVEVFLYDSEHLTLRGHRPGRGGEYSFTGLPVGSYFVDVIGSGKADLLFNARPREHGLRCTREERGRDFWIW